MRGLRLPHLQVFSFGWNANGRVILFADKNTPLYCFDFLLKFHNLEKAWKESEIGARIQIFDISFEPELQTYMGHDFFKIKATDEDIIFSAQPKFLHAVGLVKNRYSMTIGQYKEKTGFDPVSEHHSE